jgi:hypothetical protein
VAAQASSASVGQVLTIRSMGTGLGGPRTAVVEPVELARRVRVGVQREPAARLERLPQQALGRVEPVRP